MEHLTKVTDIIKHIRVRLVTGGMPRIRSNNGVLAGDAHEQSAPSLGVLQSSPTVPASRKLYALKSVRFLDVYRSVAVRT